MGQDVLEHGGVAQVPVGEHDDEVARGDVRVVVEVFKRAAGHTTCRREGGRVADARAIVDDLHDEADAREHRHERAAHVAAAEHVAHGLGAHGLAVELGALVPHGDVAAVVLGHHARGRGGGVGPVLDEPRGVAGLGGRCDVREPPLVLGGQEAHGKKGIATAGHVVLRVGHPLERGGRGLAVGRRGEELALTRLGDELDVSAAHGADEGAVGQREHARALVARHGA